MWFIDATIYYEKVENNNKQAQKIVVATHEKKNYLKSTQSLLLNPNKQTNKQQKFLSSYVVQINV